MISNRAIIIRICFILVGLVYIIRLFMLQVIDPSYKYYAENNTQRKITQYPSRGLIYDRNGKLLVSNQAVYDIMIVPREVVSFDTLEFSKALGLPDEEVVSMLTDVKKAVRANKISAYKPSVFYKQLSAEHFAHFQEKLHLFKGFYAQRRTVRKYEYPFAAHVLGYVAEINESRLKKDPYYSMGDYIGISGIENSYEQYLRGKKGARYVMVDVHGLEKGPMGGGRLDTAAVAGKNISVALDVELQKYGEELMKGKIGSIIAIEPSSGEILTMVSSPGYDPSLLVGRERNRNFPALSTDSLYPLLNRAIMSGYPPGSTFKTIMGLIGLQEGVISPSTSFPCNHGFHARGISVGCHSHSSPLSLAPSLANSCNAYYCFTLRSVLDNPAIGSPKIALEKWRTYLKNFGFGERLGSDFFNENRGFVPSSEYYDRIYNGSWGSLTVISLGIGQGELLVTPLQMANMTAAIANRGYFYTPHVIKEIEGDSIPSRFNEKHFTGIDAEHFEPIVHGMYLAVNGEAGATARIARIPGIEVCGKTGTAQNPHGKDHAIFIAFAPKEDPKIAIAVYVENAGFGASTAAPIASLMIERYLKESIDPSRKWLEDRILNLNLINERKQ